MANTNLYRWFITGAVIIVVVIGGEFAWNYFQEPELPDGFTSGNGRIEATEIDIATKLPGRLEDVFVQEGDRVEPGQQVARLDTKSLEAQLRSMEARVEQAQKQRDQALAIIRQRDSELALAVKELTRSRAMRDEDKGAISQEKLDRDVSAVEVVKAARSAAEAGVANANAAIKAAAAEVDRIKADIEECMLKTSHSGRVLYRLAEPGEVLGAGGKVLTIIDLTNVYMTIFIPTKEAGRISLGADARLIFDARPDLVIPATVSFVAAEAQFTPKQVETRSEREKLMFRIKLKIDPDLLQKHIEKVKTGVRGIAYVRLDPEVEWPQHLQINLPD